LQNQNNAEPVTGRSLSDNMQLHLEGRQVTPVFSLFADAGVRA
jgi:hypothetical protein